MVICNVDEGLGGDSLSALVACVIGYKLIIAEALRAEAQVLGHDGSFPVI